MINPNMVSLRGKRAEKADGPPGGISSSMTCSKELTCRQHFSLFTSGNSGLVEIIDILTVVPLTLRTGLDQMNNQPSSRVIVLITAEAYMCIVCFCTDAMLAPVALVVVPIQTLYGQARVH